MNLSSIFAELNQDQPTLGEIRVQRFPNQPGVYLGINGEGDALLLLEDEGVSIPTRKLEAITIDYGRLYTTSMSGAVVTKKYSSICLRRSHFPLLDSFCRLTEALVLAPNRSIASANVRTLIDNFVALFANRAVISREKIKGLFGELLLINSNSDVESWVDAWHSSNSAKKDFSFPSYYLEVKTSESKKRLHRIGLNQISSRTKPVFLASIVIMEDSMGLTLFDLLSEILGKLANEELYSKTLSVVFDTLGSNSSEADDLRFMPRDDSESILFFDCANLPRPFLESGAYSTAIESIEFDLDVSQLLVLGLPSTQLPVTG